MVFLILLPLEIILLYLLAHRTSRKILMVLNKVVRNHKISVYLFSALLLPGTFVHEMSHFLTALFLAVPVGKVELFPVIEERKIRMGSVAIGKTDPIRRTLVGIAPVVFGLAIILGSVFFVYQNNLFRQPLVLTLLSYVVFEVGNTMFSSKKDLEGAFTVFATAAIIYLFLYFFGFRIYLNLDSEVVRQAVVFLLIPIGIDLLLLVL